MPGHHAVLVNDQLEARRFLEEIGSTPMGVGFMVPKAVFKCIKLKNIPARAANILKQEMLANGGEAAVGHNAARCEGTTDMLLMGTLKQYRRLIAKLRLQPFGLKAVAADIKAILANLEIETWQVPLAQGKVLEMGRRSLVMGILNVTPDSFSDGGRFFAPGAAVEHAQQMAADGADIIDVGGASSRPGSQMVDEAEELRRVLPVVEQLSALGMTIAVDTFRAGVAQAVLEAGAHLINDIGGFTMDPGLLPVLVKWQAPVVLMHNRLQIRQDEPYTDLIADIIQDLQSAMEQAAAAGLGPERILIDPGLGFGKNPAENLEIIRRLQDFRSLGRPILIGASRKRFIGHTLDLDTPERLEGSLAVAVMAVMNGVAVVRVHDVKESVRVMRMTDAVRWNRG
ncbi:MAG: dihydropteroate synthase [Syntrophomonadaceae bacterium]